MIYFTIYCKSRSNKNLKTMMTSVSKFIKLLLPSTSQEINVDEKNIRAEIKLGHICFEFDDENDDFFLMEFIISRFLIRLNKRIHLSHAELSPEW